MSRGLARAARVRFLLRHPAPYRDPLMDRIAALPGIDLDVEYLGTSFAQTPWARGELGHRHRFAHRLVEWTSGDHDLAVHPGVVARLATRRPDACVLAAWADPTVIAAAGACRALRIPYLLISESFLASGRSGAPPVVRRAVRGAVVRGASAWLPTGTRARDWLASLGADPARSFFFPTSPDVRRWSAHVEALRREAPGLRRELGLPDDDVVVFVGRVVHDKAPDVLLDAMAQLVSRRPRARLVLVGDGPLLDGLRRHPAAGSVDFRGFRQPPEVARLVAASDVLVLPSRYETWGAVATEALACGLPIVLSEDVGCAPDLLPDGESPPVGARVPTGDAAALAAAIDRVLAWPDRRTSLPQRALSRALEWGHDLNVRSLVQALAAAGIALPQATLAAAGAAAGRPAGR